MTKLNYRHSIKTLNIQLRKAGKKERVEFKHAQAGNDVYRVIEPCDNFNSSCECGIYYTKTDLVEFVSDTINN